MSCELPNGQTDLIAYYQFNEGIAGGNNISTTGLPDAGPNNHDGTLLNFALTPGITSNWIGPGGVSSGIYCAYVNPPEITVKGNGNAIANRSLSVSTTDDTDFGTAAVAGGMVSRTFSIENMLGSLDLSLDGMPLVNIAGRDQSDFSLTVQPGTSAIASGNSSTFEVKFTPTATGLRTALVVITHNDLPENPFVFTVSGVGN